MLSQLQAIKHFGILTLSGQDVGKFLQGQITCDINKLSAEKGSLGAYCDHKGRVLAVFYILYLDNRYILLLPKDILATTMQELKKYAQFSKISVEDITDKYYLYGLVCDNADSDKLSLSLPKSLFEIIRWQDLSILKISDEKLRYLVISTKQIIESTTYPQQLWHIHDISAQIPWIHVETLGLFLPQNLDLEKLHAISYDKGCYRGQEIIARMHYIGKQKQGLLQITIDKHLDIQNGAEILDQENHQVGHVVLVAQDESKTYLLVTLLFTAKEKGNLYINNLKIW